MPRLQHDPQLSRDWLRLAIASLIFAGLFAIAIVVARVPVVDQWMGDPGFFRRCLTVHVTLSLCVWFYAFFGALYHAIPHRDAGGKRPWNHLALGLGASSFVLVLSGAVMRDAEPLLVNYIPIIDAMLFRLGLVGIGVAVMLSMLDGRTVRPGQAEPNGMPTASITGLRAASYAFVLAMFTFAGSVLAVPDVLIGTARYELIVWGGGHVLQFVNVLAMVSVWFWLLRRSTGDDPATERAARWLLPLLVLPLIPAPIIAGMGQSLDWSREYFTQIMRWCIFPQVTVFVVLGVRRVVRHVRANGRGALADAHILAFLVSATLTVAGFVIGSMIRGQTTMIPAHYHASIGGVTVAYMGAAYLLLDRAGLFIAARRVRLSHVQPVVYGVGQLLFAIGFGLAGAHGTARKVYGAEQQIPSLGASIGLGTMGIGGLVAVAGGFLLLTIVVSPLFSHPARTQRASGRFPWTSEAIVNIRSSD